MDSVVYITVFEFGLIGYTVKKTKLMSGEIGACYALAPLVFPTMKQKQLALFEREHKS